MEHDGRKIPASPPRGVPWVSGPIWDRCTNEALVARACAIPWLNKSHGNNTFPKKTAFRELMREPRPVKSQMQCRSDFTVFQLLQTSTRTFTRKSEENPREMETKNFLYWYMERKNNAPKKGNWTTYKEMKHTGLMVLGLAEIRWNGSGKITKENYTIFYSGNETHTNAVEINVENSVAKNICGVFACSEF